jgi:predicted methyltransferase
VLSDPTKVVVGAEDIKNIEEFFSHFRMPMPEALQAQINVFKKDPTAYTLDQQKLLRVEVAHAIVSSDHELMKDGVFDNITNNCDKEWFESQFQKDMEEVFSKED